MNYTILHLAKFNKDQICTMFTYYMFLSVLRFHLNLMRIQILDPQWKKMDPDRDLGHFLKFTEFFFDKAELSNLLSFFRLFAKTL